MLFLLELLVLFFKNTEFLLQVIDFLCRSLLHGVHSLREDAHAFGGCLHFGFKQYAGFVGWLITSRRQRLLLLLTTGSLCGSSFLFVSNFRADL